MGGTSRIFCKKCNYEINVNTGLRMMYLSLDNLAISGYKEYNDIFNMRDELKKYTLICMEDLKKLYIFVMSVSIGRISYLQYL